MDVNEPMARLMRLRGSLAQALPSDAVKDTDAEGLVGAYGRFRAAARSLADDLGVEPSEFDAQFPEGVGEPVELRGDPIRMHRLQLKNEAVARKAAQLLRELAGFLGGLLEHQALEMRITQQQLAAAREAAKPSVGFRAP